jgi:hypothetical protein
VAVVRARFKRLSGKRSPSLAATPSKIAFAIVTAATISLIAHFGPWPRLNPLITISSWGSSGLEMTTIGAIKGVVTYVIGST